MSGMPRYLHSANMGSSTEYRSPFVALLLLTSLIFVIPVSGVAAFAPNVPAGKEFRQHRRPSVLQTSLSTAPDTTPPSLQEGVDNADRISHLSEDRSNFRTHLKMMGQSTRSKVTLANRMDDELKRIETRFFKLSTENAPVCRYEATTHAYKGPAVEPDVSCYAMVANAYAKARLGRTGAELAEEVYRRCQTHSIVQRPNAILKTACLSAWMSADNWERVDVWLADMESTFAETGKRWDAPDTVAYTCYLEGLASSRELNGTEIARRGQEFFLKVLRLAESGENPYVKPNRYTYIAAIKCVTREENGVETLNKAEGLLRELQALYAETKDPDMKPRTVAYLSVLNTAARCKAGIEGARRAEALVLELQKLNEDDPDYRLLEPCWTACLTAYARVEPEYAAEGAVKVDGFLERMESDETMSRPSVHVYTAAINAKVNDSDPRSVEQAAAILRSLKKPDSIAYQCVIKAFARIGYAAKADSLLWELQGLSVEGSPVKLDPPDVITIAACINSWAKGHVVDIEKAADSSMKLLDLVIDAYRHGAVQSYHKNVESWIFDEVIRLWSISRRPSAGEQAEKLIDKMYGLQKTAKLFAPSFHTFILALDAWSSSGRRDAGTRSMKLLEKMERLHAEGALSEGVNIRALSTALISVTNKAGGRASWSIAQSLFERIVKLYAEGDRSASINARTMTSVLACIIRSSDRHAPAQAIELLKRIKYLSDNGMDSLRPNTIVYNCVLNGLAQKGMAEEAERLLNEMNEMAAVGYPCAPDVVTISCVCRAFANSKLSQTGPRAEKYLRQTRERYEEGETRMKPDTRLYNSVITAYVNDSYSNPKAAEKADELLHEMQLSAACDNIVVPDLVSFSSVCQAYSKSPDPSALEKAVKVFERAEQSALDGILEFPDIVFFSSVVLAFTRSKSEKATEKAEGLVRHMQKLSEKGRDVKPNTIVYNTLLSSYATSQHSDRVDKAKALFAEMKERYASGEKDAGPDVTSHNWLILVSARSPSPLPVKRREHFNLALEHFRELHGPDSTVKPNSFTYCYFLKACQMLLPDGDGGQKLAGKTLELCKQNGLVTREVIVEAYMLDQELVRRELGQEGVKIEKSCVPYIPDKWCSEVPPRKRFNNIDLKKWQR